MPLFWYLLSTLIGLLTYLYYKLRQDLNYWQSLGIPCEKPSFALGNITGLNTERSFTEIWQNYYTKFKGTGPFAGFYWFRRPAAFILDTSLIKHILISDFSKFTDRGFFSNPEDDPLTGTLFSMDGHKWRNMRQKLSPTFTSGKMKFMFPTVMSVGKEFVNVFDDVIQKNSVIEVKDLMARFTTDVIGTCAFGIECNSLKDPDVEFRVMGKKSLTDRRHNNIVGAFMASYPQLAERWHFKLTPEHIEEFFMRIVRDTVNYREQNNIKRNDFMELLIELKNNKLIKSEHGEDLTNLTMEEVAAQTMLFFKAGFETSSTTMGFALYELAQHEDIQERAREEINAVWESHNKEFNYGCIKDDMQYLDQIIAETLRLYTVLPVLNRQCVEDYVVPGYPNYVIKKGMPVLIPVGAIHRDADYYSHPDVFNPDNFSPEMVQKRDSIEWLPFGIGPRNCLGIRFGEMQTRIGLALLLQHFKFSVCPQTQIPMKYDRKAFLVSSEEGIYLKVERIY